MMRYRPAWIRGTIVRHVSTVVLDVRLGYALRDKAVILVSHVVFLAGYAVLAVLRLFGLGSKHRGAFPRDLDAAWRTSFVKRFRVSYRGMLFYVRPRTYDILNFVARPDGIIAHVEGIARSRPDGVFVDVGANMGVLTIALARSVGPNGRVVSIEPAPDNFKNLEANVRLNKCTNVVQLNFACSSSDYAGALLAPLDRRSTGLYSLGGSIYELSQDSVAAQVRRLDGLLRSLNVKRIDLLKIDVEGAETEVLIGAGDYLSDCGEVIFEAWDAEHLDSCSRK
jgi:FkbM family methyltransferase